MIKTVSKNYKPFPFLKPLELQRTFREVLKDDQNCFQKRQTVSIFKTSGATENFLGSFDDIIQQLLSYSHILGFPTKASDKFSWIHVFLFNFPGLSARVQSDVRPSKRRERECGGWIGGEEGGKRRGGGETSLESQNGDTHGGHCTCQAKSGNWFVKNIHSILICLGRML